MADPIDPTKKPKSAAGKAKKFLDKVNSKSIPEHLNDGAKKVGKKIKDSGAKIADGLKKAGY